VDPGEASWTILLDAYEGERPLPERVRRRLDGYLLAFDAMQKMAAVNRGLSLLSSDGTEAAKGAGRGPAFLRNSLMWLTRHIGHLTALSCGAGALTEIPLMAGGILTS
jgi:hypothetical protein